MQANALVNCVTGIHPQTQCVHSVSWGGGSLITCESFSSSSRSIKTHAHTVADDKGRANIKDII